MNFFPQASFEKYCRLIEQAPTIQKYGWVRQVIGLVIEGAGPPSAVGDMCRVHLKSGKMIFAEVVGFRGHEILLMPLEETRGIEPGCKIVPLGFPAQARVGQGLLGRVLDGMGLALDGKGPLSLEETYPLYSHPANPVARQRISRPVDVGIRAINALLTVGKGQRMAIFSGSGVGKSTLLGMMARHTGADVNVVALIGERGREVREFLEKDLGEEGLKRSVVIVATSDLHPLQRIRAAYLAAAIAEYFRNFEMDVLFMMDSITRLAMALREVGLAIGEPPAAKGYTPTVFAQLPKLLERAGTSITSGSITGIYTVLVEGDDMSDPVADAIRSIADGHIVLSRDLANQGHYPAIDVLASISRVMADVVPAEQMAWRQQLVSLMAAYKRTEDLIQIGAYAQGSNPEVDRALKKMPAITAFLRQRVDEKADLVSSTQDLQRLFANA